MRNQAQHSQSSARQVRTVKIRGLVFLASKCYSFTLAIGAKPKAAPQTQPARLAQWTMHALSSVLFLASPDCGFLLKAHGAKPEPACKPEPVRLAQWTLYVLYLVVGLTFLWHGTVG